MVDDIATVACETSKAMAGHVGPADLPRVLIVGNSGGTHVGSSLMRAAAGLGHASTFFDIGRAHDGNRLLRSLLWRFGDHRPIRLRRFSDEVVAASVGLGDDATVLISTGHAPLTASALTTLRSAGIFCANFSTDDPWNLAQRAEWYLRALPAYDVVFTPRRSNIQDFRDLGCRDVHYLPFGYDESLFGPDDGSASEADPPPDVLFVGGADRERAAFVDAFLRSGPRVGLVGSYWERFRSLRAFSLGIRNPASVRRLTTRAAVNLCLVRRANRDGHVMRTFEIAASGGFMLAEDTEEHRDLLGPAGECVLYFSSPEQAAEQAHWAIGNPMERQRMAAATFACITRGRHTYGDRLQRILGAR